MEIRIGPNFVSTLYFVLFTLIVLPLVDDVVTRLVNYVAYKNIFRGQPIRLESADIPGITTGLLGKWFSPTNVVALLLKCVLLGIIFVLDLNIETFEVHSREVRQATFVFNASDSQWRQRKPTVNRPFSRLQYCRKLTVNTGEITYYGTAFNLRNDSLLTDQNATRGSTTNDSSIDGNSFQCLAPQQVYEHYVVKNLHVKGCSLVQQKFCTSQDPVSLAWPGSFNGGSFVISPLLYDRYTFDDAKVPFVDQVQVQSVWTSLASPSLVCLIKQLPGNSSGIGSTETDCLLHGRTQDTNTLLEHWKYVPDANEIHRSFAGILLRGDVDIGKSVRISMLWYMHQDADWSVLSALLLGYSMVYEERPMNFTRIGEVEYAVTVIPDYAVPLICALVVSAIIAKVIVCLTIGKDKRPPINTINGISSILRQQVFRSVNSLTYGPTTTLAWYCCGNFEPRFGPFLSTQHVAISIRNKELQQSLDLRAKS